MTDDVKGARPDEERGTRRRRGRALRSDLVAETERRILDAAAELFRRDGYAATTLAAVARAAEVGERTVYVRFGTKVALLKRVVDVTVSGGSAQPAMTAATAAERIAEYARFGRLIMERTGALFAVAQEAAATEPVIAKAWQGGRVAAWRGAQEFWAAMVRDGLLPDDVDLAWLADTTAVLSEPETYLMIGKLWDWDLDRYEAWLGESFTRLMRAAGPI